MLRDVVTVSVVTLYETFIKDLEGSAVIDEIFTNEPWKELSETREKSGENKGQ